MCIVFGNSLFCKQIKQKKYVTITSNIHTNKQTKTPLSPCQLFYLFSPIFNCILRHLFLLFYLLYPKMQNKYCTNKHKTSVLSS